VLGLANEIRKAMEVDWNNQRNAGQRYYSWSKDKFDKKFYESRHPTLTTRQFLSTVKRYVAANEKGDLSNPRTWSTERLMLLVDYLYNEQYVDYGWPAVEKVFKTYKDGKYLYIAKTYLKQDAYTKIEHLINNELTQDETLKGDGVIEALRAVLKLKRERHERITQINKLEMATEQTSIASREEKSILTEYKTQLRVQNELIEKLTKRIETLEGLLLERQSSDEDLERIRELIKQTKGLLP